MNEPTQTPAGASSGPTTQEVPRISVDAEITAVKELRRDIDGQIQKLKALPGSREGSLAITKLQEGVMWLGMRLKAIGEAHPDKAANPYPHSKDPSSTLIDKTADNLKL